MRRRSYSKLLLYIIPYFVFLLPLTMHLKIKAFFDKISPSKNRVIAVVKNPVIDLNNSFPSPINPAAAPETYRCRRAHQGLYNELVEIIKQYGTQVKVAYNTIIYGIDEQTQKSLNTFWTHKNNIVRLKDLDPALAASIPNPQYAEEPTVVLIFPWQQFSVGTRFKHLQERDTQSAYAVARADYCSNTVLLDFIPRDHAIQEIKQDHQSTRKLFVYIIHNLVDTVTRFGPDAVIPYIWGGSSFIRPYKQNNFYKKNGNWHREGEQHPYTGYDCSEFVMRTAQIAGIEFPWKTTTVIERSKRKLTQEDQLQDGDLLWVKGHIMIISNTEQNELIESRSYISGYGCVHRITLQQCFENITTYNDLLERYYANETIRFKDKQGNPMGNAYAFKLLKLID